MTSTVHAAPEHPTINMIADQLERMLSDRSGYHTSGTRLAELARKAIAEGRPTLLPEHASSLPASLPVAEVIRLRGNSRHWIDPLARAS